MRNIFLEKSYTECGGKTSPGPFSKKSELSILRSQNWDLQSTILYNFLLYIQVEDYRNILKLRCSPLAFTTCNDISKNKRGLELVSLHDFLHDFWRKTFLALHSINWANLNVFLLLILEILGNMCVVIVCNQVVTS